MAANFREGSAMTEQAMARIPERGFPQAEFVARLEKAQAMMAAAGLAALFLSTEHNRGCNEPLNPLESTL